MVLCWLVRRAGLAVLTVVGMGAAPGALADPPPYDPQNPYLLDWGRATPDQPAAPQGAVERPMNAAERGQAAFELALASYERGHFSLQVAGAFAQRAATGDRVAEFYYAECLRLGRGVAVNLEAALHYYELAKQHGSPDAQAGLEALAVARARAAEAARAEAAQNAAWRAADQEAMALKGNAVALAWCRSQAEAGVAGAGLKLGRIEAALGHDVAAARLLRALEKAGGLAAADRVLLARVLASGKVKPARGEVLGLYAKAEAGGEVVWKAVAGLYLDGAGGVPKNAREGMRILETHAAIGDPAAMVELGRRYEGGLGVVRSLVKALGWYTQAGGMGCVARARIYEQGGPGVARDLRRAAGLYRSGYVQSGRTDEVALAALERMRAAGSVEAEAALGWLAYTGQVRGVRVAAPDVEGVWRYYEAAAAEGDADAQYALGVLFEWQAVGTETADWYGVPWGRPRRGGYPEAHRWLGLAATAGHPDALERVGGLFLLGWGTAKDPVKALASLRAAAAQGYAGAMYLIGSMISAGTAGGVELGTAASWYEKAAMGGSVEAARALGR